MVKSHKNPEKNKIPKKKKKKLYTWNFAVVISIVIFILYLLFMKLGTTKAFSDEMPNNEIKTICIGLLISVIMFLVIGIFFRLVNPDKIKFDKKNKRAYKQEKFITGIII